jgi:hypothetical protein
LLGKPAFVKHEKVAIANIELVKQRSGIQKHEEPLFDEFILPTQKSLTVMTLSSSLSVSTHSESSIKSAVYIDCDGYDSSSSIDAWEHQILS